MTYTIQKQIRTDLPQVGYAPYRQVHAHSTGNSKSTADGEASYFSRKNYNEGFYTHVVGNGKVIQVGATNRGAYDVGGAWNAEGYASVELIESHATKEEFMKDYKIYCELLHNLAVEAGIPITVDTDALEGIKTHNYCTYHQPNNGSDHVDPLPYLTKWGITMERFRADVTGAKSNKSNNDKPKGKGKKKMIVFKTVDTKRAYVSDGITLRWVKTGRLLKTFEAVADAVDTVYQEELLNEFGKDVMFIADQAIKTK